MAKKYRRRTRRTMRRAGHTSHTRHTLYHLFKSKSKSSSELIQSIDKHLDSLSFRDHSAQYQVEGKTQGEIGHNMRQMASVNITKSIESLQKDIGRLKESCEENKENTPTTGDTNLLTKKQRVQKAQYELKEKIVRLAKPDYGFTQVDEKIDNDKIKENIDGKAIEKIEFYMLEVVKLVDEGKLTEAKTLMRNCFSGGDFSLEWSRKLSAININTLTPDQKHICINDIFKLAKDRMVALQEAENSIDQIIDISQDQDYSYR